MKRYIVIGLILFSSVVCAQINADKVDALIFGKSYTTAELNALSNPPLYLLVMNEDIPGFVYYNGTSWVGLAGGDENDFVTGLSLAGTTLTANVPNQTNPTVDLSSLQTTITGNETAFNGWDKDASDDVLRGNVTNNSYGSSLSYLKIDGTDNGYISLQKGASNVSYPDDLEIVFNNADANGIGGLARYTFAADGTPVRDNDVITKSYADANYSATGTDDQTLAEVLTQGNTANLDIDMNGNDVFNTLRYYYQDLDSDTNVWTSLEFFNGSSPYDGDLGFSSGAFSRFIIPKDGIISEPLHGITKAYADANYIVTGNETPFNSWDKDASDDLIQGTNTFTNNLVLSKTGSGELFINDNQSGIEYSASLGVTVYSPSNGVSEDGYVALTSEEGTKSSLMHIFPNLIRTTTKGSMEYELQNAAGGPARIILFDSVYDGVNDVATKADVDAAISGIPTGTDDQTASEVTITDTGANFTATDVEGALAELSASGGTAEYRNPDINYVARATGSNVTDEWFETTGQENKITINTSTSVNPLFPNFYEIPTFTSLKMATVRSVLIGGSPLVFTSDNYRITGSGASIVNIAPAETSGVVGVYVDSLNVMRISKANTASPSNLIVDGYFKPYSISQVTGVTSSAETETTATISWNAATASVGTISNYEYSIDSATPVSVTGATTANLTGLTASTTYNINVRAVDGGGNKGQYSADLSVTTSSVPLFAANALTPTPNEVAGVAGLSCTGCTIALNADAQNGTNSIEVTATSAAFRPIITLTGLPSGSNITATWFIKNVTLTGGSYNVFPGLYTDGGWTTQSNTAQWAGDTTAYTSVNVTSTSNTASPVIRLTSGTGSIGDVWRIDNLTITVN